MRNTPEGLSIGGVEITPAMVAERLPAGLGAMTTLDAAHLIAQLVAQLVAQHSRREDEEVLFVRPSGTINRDAHPVAVTFTVVFGTPAGEGTWVNNRHETLTVTAEEVTTIAGWVPEDTTTVVDPITAAVERMSTEQLQAAARALIVAKGWLSLNPEHLEDEHRGYADDAIRVGVPGFLEEEETAHAHASDLDDDIARCNYWRSLMNYVPLDGEGQEVIPEVTAEIYHGDRLYLDLPRPVSRDEARTWCAAAAAELGAHQGEAFKIKITLDYEREVQWGEYTFRLTVAV